MLDTLYPSVIPGPPRPSRILTPRDLERHHGRERHVIPGGGALMLRLGVGDRLTLVNDEGGQMAELVAAIADHAGTRPDVHYQRQPAITPFEVTLLDILAFPASKIVYGKQARGAMSITLCNPELVAAQNLFIHQMGIVCRENQLGIQPTVQMLCDQVSDDFGMKTAIQFVDAEDPFSEFLGEGVAVLVALAVIQAGDAGG